MLSFFQLFTLLLALPVVGMLFVMLYRLQQHPQERRIYWLLTALIFSLVIFGGHLLPFDWMLTDTIGRDFTIWLVLILTQISFTAVIIRDTLHYRQSKWIDRLFYGLSLIWVAGFIVLILIQTESFAGWSRWNQQENFLAGLFGAGGGVLMGALAIAFAFNNFYRTALPDVANRSALMILLTGTHMLSFVLLSAVSQSLQPLGLLILNLSLAGAVYAHLFYRVADVRRGMLVTIRISLITFFTWSLSFAALYFIYRAELSHSPGSLILIAGVALIIAVLFVPIRQFIEGSFRYLIQRSTSTPELATAIASYTRNVASAASLEEVVQATTDTLNTVIQVSHSALILMNTTYRVPDSVELIVLDAASRIEAPAKQGYLSRKSPIYETLAIEKSPLTQFDIEYDPAFKGVTDEEHQFFRSLDMRAYIPIVTDNRLIGLLVCGRKRNDTPFYDDDLEMLMIVGQQVGTALRSARLIDDLQHLNNSMRALNKRLENARVELEKLDSVKTDFITIASHELRTPLAQIRGYTDILESMNDQNLLTPSQTGAMVGNLRRSAERMGELISAMLDVSQLDVAAMDLRFSPTGIETMVKLAIEPLQDALQQREQQITYEGLSDLPRIHADMQRMVQALRNLIQNAIKFTPDGGRIHINGSHEHGSAESGDEYVLLTISDDGIGIAAKDIELIFQKFYRGFDTQLHSSGAYKFMGAGPGLGLTIAKGIIEGHGGRLRAESPGHSMEDRPGATFYVQLPVHPPEGQRRVLSFEKEDTADKLRTSENPNTQVAEKIDAKSSPATKISMS